MAMPHAYTSIDSRVGSSHPCVRQIHNVGDDYTLTMQLSRRRYVSSAGDTGTQTSSRKYRGTSWFLPHERFVKPKFPAKKMSVIIPCSVS